MLLLLLLLMLLWLPSGCGVRAPLAMRCERKRGCGIGGRSIGKYRNSDGGVEQVKVDLVVHPVSKRGTILR